MYTWLDLFIARGNKKYDYKFDYSKFIYVNAKTKGIIICPIHGEFLQNPDKHLSKDSNGCQECWGVKRRLIAKCHHKKEPKAVDVFLKLAEEKFGDKFKYNLSNYNGLTRNLITIECPIHGEFFSKPREHLKGYGCPKCGREAAIENTTDTYDEFLIKVNKKFNKKYTYLESNRESYLNKKSIVDIICPEHGLFKKKAQKHLSGQACFKCRINELTRDGILLGGYNPVLFERKPETKELPAKLYYLKINDGEFYKIGITARTVKGRIKSIKHASKGIIKKVEILKEINIPLYNAYLTEQKIILDNKENRLHLFWSSEIFNKDISKQISKYFK